MIERDNLPRRLEVMSKRGPRMVLLYKRLCRGLVTLIICGLLEDQTACAQGPSKSEEPPGVTANYLNDIKPLLREKCFSCHSSLKQEGGLRLDAASLIQKGGDSGPARVAGSAEDSSILQRVTADDDSRMPPEEVGTRLTLEEIEQLRAWIKSGAIAPEEAIPESPSRHWSFLPPVQAEVPSVSASWILNDIDRFLAAEHQRVGVSAVGETSRSMLLRRASLALTGLPPTPAERRAFLDDNSKSAFEDAVDRMLESPRYGERWARHFMDIWRYSDPSGYGAEIRDGREHIWRWRDWIVESLNEDKGYDRMVVEMLAADEAFPEDQSLLRATGFLARNWYKFNRNVWLDNIVEHSSKAFLGLTLNCARCHDHKYDPLEQQAYYRMRAIFETHDLRDDALRLASAGPTNEMLVRAYDAHLDRKTFTFLQGNEDRPDIAPLTPGLPELFGELSVEPVSLSVTVWYPALRKESRDAALEAARAAIVAAEAGLTNAQTALAASRRKLAEFQALKPDLDDSTKQSTPSMSTAEFAQLDATALPPETQLAPAAGESTASPKLPTRADLQRDVKVSEVTENIAVAHLQATQSAAVSLEARIAAETVKHGLASGMTDALATAAGSASRQHAADELSEQVAQTQSKIEQARQAQETLVAPANAAAELQAAEEQLAELQKNLAVALEQLNSGSNQYAAIGPQYPQTSSGRRLAFARWITNPQNPLAARVLVNHVWLRHFDEPLLERAFDFGLRSEKPRHAALLDWLAVQFMQDGWSLKKLHKRIVMSGVYRLSSSPSEASVATRTTDPDNHTMWRMNARRMEAEVVRDSVLSLGASLDLTMGGPPIEHTQGETVPRRSLYFRQDKERQMTFLSLFDGAKVNECYQRKSTVAPQQALALFNSQLAAGQALKIAETHANLNGRELVDALFEHVLCRLPTSVEQAECMQFLTEFNDSPAARRQLALVLLNHNDFVTIR